MKVTTRKKPAFRDFYESGTFTRIVATKTDKGKWRLPQQPHRLTEYFRTLYQ